MSLPDSLKPSEKPLTIDEIHNELTEKVEEGSEEVVNSLLREIDSGYYIHSTHDFVERVGSQQENIDADYIERMTVFDSYQELLDYGLQELTGRVWHEQY